MKISEFIFIKSLPLDSSHDIIFWRELCPARFFSGTLLALAISVPTLIYAISVPTLIYAISAPTLIYAISVPTNFSARPNENVSHLAILSGVCVSLPPLRLRLSL